ncbi:SGNH/GDSL hydrolase family protein [Mumia sp. zg.B17]|uniref:SGNH/GDSL hydrolase family protein n=1 Tax=unclassified Mumia TaxID=2621872 RepID=UPI001C6EFE61|nr:MULTISPECIES: SGNH/GDSL hydrolase family protein [unclassified Mumia]MBW9204385.1 SGNH/GDSL hydrolase family protein [Mumia sp. zg.B17]MBW9209630.1 SGNH/GDSL hydrolase family protein [Mumia sp. zg.B21]MDD9350174.1 SGNH/GDSL hydrolase family protein [Mumia sp.]
MRARRVARPRLLDVSWRARLAVVLLLLTISAAFLTDLGQSRADAVRCERFTSQSEARRVVGAPAGKRVVVIGDSWSAGLGLDDAGDAWTSRLSGQVHVDAFSGSGFSRSASPCDGSWFAARAARAVAGGADLVVIAGGLNDVDQTPEAVRAGFERVMRSVQGPPVVVVGPAAAPARERGARRVDAQLALLAGRAGAAYVSTVGLDLPYLDDGLHLTPAGHRELGDFVAESLVDLGVD